MTFARRGVRVATPDRSRSSRSPRVLDESGTNWSFTPYNVMKSADFMARAGMIASAPAPWRDLYFPEAVSDRPGG